VIKLFQSLRAAVGTTGIDFNKFLAVVSGVFTAALEFINIFFEGVRAGAQGLGLLLDGEFAKAGDKLGEAIRKINPIDVAITQGKRLGGAYRDAYEESLNFSTLSQLLPLQVAARLLTLTRFSPTYQRPYQKQATRMERQKKQKKQRKPLVFIVMFLKR
jgi:hypothetical protein